MYISPIWGAKTPGRIKPNFLVVDVQDLITPFKFGDDRFRGLGLAEGQSLPFPIYFEGRPYNTHTIVRGVIMACAVATSCCISEVPSQWGKANFDTKNP